MRHNTERKWNRQSKMTTAQKIDKNADNNDDTKFVEATYIINNIYTMYFKIQITNCK